MWNDGFPVANSVYNYTDFLKAVGNTLFFRADGTNGTELWKSDEPSNYLTDYHYHYVQNLTYGTYSVNLGLYYYASNGSFTYLDSYSYNFTVYNSSSNTGCGYDAGYAYVDANSYYTTYNSSD